jgi:TonB family protein
LCRTDYELKKIAQAVAACRKQIAITPDHMYAHNNLARALWAQGKLYEAEQEFRKQIAISPQNRWAHANLGLLLRREKKCLAAIPELETGLNIDAKNLKARDALRDCYQQTGQTGKAEQLAVGTTVPGPVIGGVISGGTLAAQDNKAPEGDYFNPDIGIKVHLPEGWRVVRQVKPGYAQPALAMVMKVGALATLVLAREHLESSAQMYRLLAEQQLAKSPDFEKTGADAISVDGVVGDRITYKFNHNKVELRGWVGFFSNGDEHYRIAALAPADIYDRYAPMYASMVRSVRFAWMHTDEKFASTVPTADGVQVLPEVAKGHLIRSIPPEYPPTARSARIQGTVVLAARISSTGDVEELKVISGHPLLVPAAIDAVKQWKYTPYTVNGEPVEVMTTIQVNFSLSG